MVIFSLTVDTDTKILLSALLCHTEKLWEFKKFCQIAKTETVHVQLALYFPFRKSTLYITCLECFLMFSSGLGERVQINKARCRLLAKGSLYPCLLPVLDGVLLKEYFMGKLPRQDTRWAKKYMRNSVILVLFLKALKIRSYRILNSLLIRDCENDLDVSAVFACHGIKWTRIGKGENHWM